MRIACCKKDKKVNKIEEVSLILAGNPNVGKSTVFNALTGMHQHTGNWAGKTVSSAEGQFEYSGKRFNIADIPGTYSLAADSEDEKAARNMICFEKSDAVVVVCGGASLERNLGLVLQILETGKRVIVCVNLMDEAKRKNILIDTDKLSDCLGVPVIGMCAKQKKGLDRLCDELLALSCKNDNNSIFLRYKENIEKAAEEVSLIIKPYIPDGINTRWAALRLMEADSDITKRILPYDNIAEICDKISVILKEYGLDPESVSEQLAAGIMEKCHEICSECVSFGKINDRDLKIDRILTSRLFGIPILLGVLAVIFWLTAAGSDYPSRLLSKGLFYIGKRLDDLLKYLNCADSLRDLAVNGIYRVLAWVVSVMLPPMAIFFPLFTLLEDIGFLPRAAFMLDGIFSRFGGCGKQPLTMAMGLGCNAAGVTGCRIIGSKRERLTAILTNNFMPCNGRFPTLIFLITVFFSIISKNNVNSAVSAAIMLCLILFAVFVTLGISFLLSKTVLKGEQSEFILELPPYRVPQIGRVIVRSVFDRTVFVLARACAAAAPAGIIIWLLANINIGDTNILSFLSGILEPVGSVIGLDGAILLGFILGAPANEIVMPIIVMCYLSTGTLNEVSDAEMLSILKESGWTAVTAVCTAIFTLFHFPCATACLTIKKETASVKCMLAAIALPTAVGITLCSIINAVSVMI